MNWFKRIIVKWVREDWENAGRVPEQDCYPSAKMSRGNSINSISTISGRASVDSEPTLQFKVYSAVGGKIVEFSRYDPKSDRTDRQIYIIGRDEDFGEKIAKISTLEALR
jgi:hypothetical protein